MNNKKRKTKYLLYGVMIAVPIYLVILIFVQMTMPIKLMIAFVLFANILFFVEIIESYQLKTALINQQLLYAYNRQIDLFMGITTGIINLIGLFYSFAFIMNSNVLLILTGLTVVATVMLSSHRLYITETKIITAYFNINIDEIERTQINHQRKTMTFNMKSGVKYDLRVYINFQDHLVAINRYVVSDHSEVNL